MKKMISCLVCFALAGCSSTPHSGVEHAGEERILSRIDDLNSRPSWVSEQNPFTIDGGVVQSLGQVSIPEGDNISAAYRIAENNAKASVSSAITQKLTYFFQNAEEGTMGANESHYIGEETSKLTTSYLRLSHRYWEKVRVVGENGQPSMQVRIFVAVQMPEEQFKASVIDAVRQAEVSREWDKLTADDTPRTTDKREPAANQAKSN
jgi:hypothetical protein